MLIIIYDNDELIKERVNSNYIYKKIIISQEEIKLIDDYSFSDGTKNKKLSYSKYEIVNGNKVIELFIYTEFDEKFELYSNNGLTFGKDESNDIVSIDDNITDDYIILKENIIQTNSKYVFVNGKPFNNHPLENGDSIDIIGFKFIYNKEFLYINNFCCHNKLNKYSITEKNIKYEVIKPSFNNYYIDTNNELVIDKLKEISLPHRNKQRNIFLQLGSSLTMSLAMLFLAYINIEKNIDSNSIYDILAILIMPITMLLSSLLWPIVSNIVEKRGYKKEYRKIKDEYLEYLYKYDNKTEEKIKKYLLKEYDSFFYKNNILKKIFYIQKNSKDFETISLGLYTKYNDYKFEECEDEEINKYIETISNKINRIANHPLKLDLKKHVVVTVSTNRVDYFFKKYLLELVTKHHYNDLLIAIYDKKGLKYKNIINIPHLFNGSIRLTFSNERDLQLLNNIQKNIIVLAFDKFDLDLPDNCRIIYFTNKQELFKNSDAVVEYKKDYGILNEDISIRFDYYLEKIDFDNCFEQISYYYIPSFKNRIYSFNDFYNSYDIENNYLSKQFSLSASFATSSGELIKFDLHENKDGPHGLIGGSTGSGKSELIVSLLLSLCIKYRPDYLNIILIDYKGGGIADSLSFNKKRIPHIIGEITNLSEGSIERLIFALSSECKKRQEAFKDMSSFLNTSITNIDDYIDLYDDGYNLPKIAHLLVIVDEFAELKKTNPDIIKQLVSFSRIGRSLGLHLILSTQKPNGVIDDEIWSNSHFKIALKLNDEKDSQDIIKSKDAAYIKNPGEFILQVDNNYLKAEALYSKQNITANKQISVSLLDDQYRVKNKKTLKDKTLLSEAMYYSSIILKTTEKLNIIPQVIDFQKPNEINRKEHKNDCFVMGIADDYLNAKKFIISIPFNENILIYSYRENEIFNLINTLNENKIESIIISHRVFKGGYIKDSILYDENEKISFIFNTDKLENRKLYLIIEDFSGFIAYDDNYIQYVYKLLNKSSSSKINIILLSKQNFSNYKIINLFNNKFIIGTSDQNELINLFGRKSRYINDSYYYDGEPISFVPCCIDTLDNYPSMTSALIRDIPSTINLEINNNNLLIGFDAVKREEVFINIHDNNLFVCLNRLIYEKIANCLKPYDIDVYLYDSSISMDKYKTIIWVGEGIYKQRLFMCDLKADLHKNEAYVMGETEGKVIRIFDYE